MTDLAWRVEQTCLLAWPALSERREGDWRLRFADGLTRRSNSANPIHARIHNVEASVAACERHFRARHLPAIFRIPSIVDAKADAHLERLGYGAEGETVTLHGTGTAKQDASVTVETNADDDWLAAMAALQNRQPRESAIYAQLVRAIAIPAGFASLRVDGAIAAQAYAAVHHGLLCFESVVTAVAHRGRGYARRVLGSLIAWGQVLGAREICLQVEAHNAPALALCRRLGATHELYRYHYRRAPVARSESAHASH